MLYIVIVMISEGMYVRIMIRNIIMNIMWMEIDWCFVIVNGRIFWWGLLFLFNWDLFVNISVFWGCFFCLNLELEFKFCFLILFILLLIFVFWNLMLNDMCLLFFIFLVVGFVCFVCVCCFKIWVLIVKWMILRNEI